MTDILSESTLSLTQAARRLPPGRGNRPVSLSCVLRWVLDGAKAPDGTRIKLEALRLGGRWVTSAEALRRFAEALTPQAGSTPNPKVRTPTARQKAIERAEKVLEKAGIRKVSTSKRPAAKAKA
jgi:hypothetical protein